MTSLQIMSLLWVLVAGILLSTVFFGGLWWTVRLGIRSKRPGLLFLGSMLLRVSIVLSGIYWVVGDSWQRLLVCMLGFILTRMIIIRLTRLRIDDQIPQDQRVLSSQSYEAPIHAPESR